MSLQKLWGMIKLPAGRLNVGCGPPRDAVPQMRFPSSRKGGAVCSSSSMVELSRWWTYAALLHVIITFISWRWHMTSSGPRTIQDPERIVCFLLLSSLQQGSRLFLGGIVITQYVSPPMHTPYSNHSALSPPPPPCSPLSNIKVNKGFQQWANEHRPVSRDACLCCLPPRTLLVYLGCQVKGRLREGETFFF